MSSKVGVKIGDEKDPDEDQEDGHDGGQREDRGMVAIAWSRKWWGSTKSNQMGSRDRSVE